MQASYPLLLVSQSLRRAQLLREAGIAFEQRSPPFADPDQPPTDLRGHEAEAYATDLAHHKAASFAKVMDEPCTLLTADTICVDDRDHLVGKPIDRDDAEAMLRRFINSEHRVITGVNLLRVASTDDDALLQAFADTAVVTFGLISDEQLDAYLASEDWQGKAGGYNLFDRQAAGWPIEVVGDPTTVVGLPMRRLVPLIHASLNSNP